MFSTPQCTSIHIDTYRISTNIRDFVEGGVVSTPSTTTTTTTTVLGTYRYRSDQIRSRHTKRIQDTSRRFSNGNGGGSL